ncbi:SGNH/GDSL hydrolase family protein [Gilvimarinus xylanilyticus]|uniref:GDSL-type esterase/lipase family protein n=1 Tax=Gilvimarinus xylanilyticus TaxID=2944139 RepID=A0A9X2HU64_9GAMM|nr:SGNH/GDSL hydrolase family protein [Gilvimarinus xylanilyticus]MCP8897694.1 GDSL-type esterase/lipase family protein [Gilvimarinus xylanilyticus]
MKKQLMAIAVLSTLPVLSSYTLANSLSNSDQLRLQGRFWPVASSALAFTWPGSAFEYRFSGTQSSVNLQVSERMRFWLELDGEGRELWVEPGQKHYQLAKGLPLGEHQIRVTRLAESFTGVAQLQGLPDTDGQLLAAPAAPERKLLVIGDSITAGYGVEGESKDCSYSQQTSNPLKAYAGLSASELNADIHTIAWSGIGVWRSYGEEEPKSPTIAERRKLILGDDFDTPWNSANYQPNAVLINIGTNDFWQGSAPGYPQAMGEMLSDVRSDYPDTPVYFILSPMLGGEARVKQADDLTGLAEDEDVDVLDLGRIQPEDGYGCDWHPNEITNTRMADKLVDRLRTDLGW